MSGRENRRGSWQEAWRRCFRLQAEVAQIQLLVRDFLQGGLQ